MPKTNHFIAMLLKVTVITNVICGSSFSQEFSPMNKQYNLIDRSIYYSTDSSIHTSTYPILNNEVAKAIDIDSILYIDVSKKWKSKLYNQHLIELNKEDFSLSFDPLFNIKAGNGNDENPYSYTNTRGIQIRATLKKKLFVYTSFEESQSMLTDREIRYVDSIGVIPGEGHPKVFKNTGYDYAHSEAYVSYSPSDFVNFQLGHGKNFIGDGYRSLLLSDVAFNYPFAKVTANVWRIKYLAMWAQFQEPSIKNEYVAGNPKEWGAFHYLDLNVAPWFSIGFFEAVLWENADSSYHRGFDPNYANPVIFMRPVEYSNGSPDNVLMGLNGKLSFWRKLHLYGQLVLDEFNLEYIKANNGWWANKWGILAGMKTFDLAGIEHLDIQAEYSLVRPFTYTHLDVMQNYGHYGQPLAHPLGANFSEAVFITKYNYKRLFFESKTCVAKHGGDVNGINYGGDIYNEYTTRASEFGHTFFQGEVNNLLNQDVSASVLFNRKTNFNAFVGAKFYKATNYSGTYFYFGIRTSLSNRYNDYF